jgi:allantoicase
MDEQLLPDLLQLRGSVVAASDEFFAAKENLIKAEPPAFVADTYGAKGQIYDGWETRRRRGPGGTLPERSARDWVVVRLGMPGVIRAVVVDTAFFSGNYPQGCSVDACRVDGYPSAEEVTGTDAGAWPQIVPRALVTGDSRHVFRVSTPRRFSHVRLNIFPDGGVARLRVHGEVLPDPALLEGLTFDLAALENGADVAARSDRNYYSSPRNIIAPGLSRVMGEGWETRRRRRPGHEWLVIRLTGHSVIDVAEIDTSWYRGNQPDMASLQTLDATTGAALADPAAWQDLLPAVRLQPDTSHRFRVSGQPATHVRLNIFPDGGVARLRLRGSLTGQGLAAIRRRWDETS